MLTQLRSTYLRYPPQFWLMFMGMLISSIGVSIIWPFLLVYVSKRLGTPLTTTASLMTINSTMALITSFGAGWVIDRVGRKWVMAGGLATFGVAYLFMGSARTFGEFALLMGITGLANPLYRIGADAMMADLVSVEKRIDAYALMRLSNNLGVAIGPAIGGFIASGSYSMAFYFAAVGMSIYSALIIGFARETMPGKKLGENPVISSEKPPRESLGGYGSILKDLPYIGFIGAFILVSISASLVWSLLSVYTTENFNLPLQLYGFIPTTNAIMCVTLQVFVTNITKRFPTLPVVATGALFYAVAVGSIGLMTGFWGFLGCMVVMTIGELIIMPTSSTYVANRAPVDKRGRYMSIYALTWGIASGTAPLFGGLLSDNYGPHFIWLGGAVSGSLAVLAFMRLAYLEHLKVKKSEMAVSLS
jgi:MFS family permease